MATIPSPVTLTNASADVLNAIRNQASNNYRDYVPIATPDAESVRQIGAVIMDYPELQNEFVSALINRIAIVVVTSKTYRNPWAVFKRGVLDFGESIEEIFVDIAKVETYNPADAENTLYKRYIPNIRSAFHVLNYEKFYPVTISDAELRKALRKKIFEVGELSCKLLENENRQVSPPIFSSFRHFVIFSCFTFLSITCREASSLWISSSEMPIWIIKTNV